MTDKGPRAEMTHRWILAAIRAAKRSDTPMPWARGAPRARMIARRKARRDERRHSA
jgi:hypothetical protein